MRKSWDKSCIGNCLICGKCANLPILNMFSVTKCQEPRKGYGIAIDIGTTTVVLALLDLAKGSVMARYSFMNPQRVFGPDVISRINAANNGHLIEMQNMITECIVSGVNELIASGSILPKDIIDITIAGNTTMAYLLLGFPCESLGAFPFQPAFKLADEYSYEILFGTNSGINCLVRILPWYAAFVGGDITAGLLYVMTMGKRRFMLIDLGTNGEMALYDNGELIITSTAAGPAFESSQPSGGASGVINELAQLVQGGIVDETGLLSDEASFTQKQIRDLQLAKSAVRSGLEILLKSRNLTYSDLDCVYLAGGIGQAMDVNNAVCIGLIPVELQEKTYSVGNASLGGAALSLFSPAAAEADTVRLAENFIEIKLAEHQDFNIFFMEYMFFSS